MAVRQLLHRNKVQAFIEWLGERALPPVGRWEMVRWKGPPKRPMRIIFDNCRSSEHVSCNDAAYHDVRKFIDESKNT